MAQAQVTSDLSLDGPHDTLKFLAFLSRALVPCGMIIHLSLLHMQLGQLLERIIEQEGDVVHEPVNEHGELGLVLTRLRVQLLLVVDICPKSP